MNYDIRIGQYALALLAGVEVHKSVDLLADTCTITLPGSVYNSVQKIDEKVKRGDEVVVKLGYDDELVEEFRGYLLNVDSDNESIVLNCEDSLFLLRKPVKDKSFKGVGVGKIAEYLISDTGVNMEVHSTVGIVYEQFVIHQATAYDVLKKLREETKANVFITGGDRPTLHIHPPYKDKGGDVAYSYQQNIEDADLKYVRQEDKRIEVVVKTTTRDGTIIEEKYGVSGGDQVYLEASGMSRKSMKEVAKSEYLLQSFDGYEGSITGWLVPYCEPTYTALIKDKEFPEKDGKYYVKSTTVSFDESGGKRKVELGIRVN